MGDLHFVQSDSRFVWISTETDFDAGLPFSEKKKNFRMSKNNLTEKVIFYFT